MPLKGGTRTDPGCFRNTFPANSPASCSCPSSPGGQASLGSSAFYWVEQALCSLFILLIFHNNQTRVEFHCQRNPSRTPPRGVPGLLACSAAKAELSFLPQTSASSSSLSQLLRLKPWLLDWALPVLTPAQSVTKPWHCAPFSSISAPGSNHPGHTIVPLSWTPDTIPQFLSPPPLCPLLRSATRVVIST